MCWGFVGTRRQAPGAHLLIRGTPSDQTYMLVFMNEAESKDRHDIYIDIFQWLGSIGGLCHANISIFLSLLDLQLFQHSRNKVYLGINLY